LCEILRAEGESVSFYHAGLPSMERSLRQDEWVAGKVRIIVATNAFGMGIDKADVRFVLHYSMCDSLEAYYQEAGRAGRDGKRSYAVLLYSTDDADRIVRLFKAEFPPLQDIKRIYEQVMNYLQVAIGDGEGGSFPFNIYEFCHNVHLSVNNVIGALKILEHNGLLTMVDEQDSPAKLMFTVSRDSLYKLNAGGNDMDLVLRSILRLYNGVFTHFRSIDELQIAAFSGLSSERVHEMLRMLWRMHIIRYIPALRTPMIYLDSERLPTADLFIAPETYRHRFDMTQARFDGMLSYVETEGECRSVIIQRYFGDQDAKACGVCDVCLGKRRSNGGAVEYRERIVKLLDDKELDIKELVSAMGIDGERVVEIVDKMVRDGEILLSERGKLKIIK
ncbi:MAG: RecQ family zinc-binding domain-containing protein, partial [Alistipes sp.]|nr:RecQ family zinc-binding domain-containing protein [Alistipes sp.]